MEKQKRWQLYLILAVIVLTLYNIFPTIFYYSKPLKDPVDATRAEHIATSIVERVNSLEGESKAWLNSFSKLLGVHPTSIELKQDDPGIFEVTFANAKDATLFKRFLPSAGALIPFVSSQLSLYPDVYENSNRVYVTRQINVHLDPKDVNSLFHFSPKFEANGEISPLYRDIVYDRAVQLALGFGGPSKAATELASITANGAEAQNDDLVLNLAQEILDVNNSLGKNHAISKRFNASFSQLDGDQSATLIQKFITRAETLKASLATAKEKLLQEQKNLKESEELDSLDLEQRLATIDRQRQSLESAIAILQKNGDQFKAGLAPLNEKSIRDQLAESFAKMDPRDKRQVLSLEGRNPFVSALIIDWNNDKISLQFYPDVEEIRASEGKTELSASLKEKVNQLLISEIARVSQATDESIVPSTDTYAVKLNKLTNTQSVLTFDLGYLAEMNTKQLLNQIRSSWIPQQVDLTREAYPILSYEEYKKLKPEDQKLGLVVYAPGMYNEEPPMGFRTGSIYVIARGLNPIMQKYSQNPSDSDAKALNQELERLNTILQQRNFIGYSGATSGVDPAFRKDYIFELDDYYSNLIKATREDFTVKGSKRAAVLNFTDVEQRILTENKIDDRIQEDLLKWKEEYDTAQVKTDATSKYLVPAPTKNVYWENFKLSFVKYFRGDDRKILKWGLDLSGGKTVRIGLKDHNNRPVTNPDDLKQAVNELYTRINNMGVSERTIRIENDNIILDFPGSQNLSAAELIKASAMYFHIVNEKFSQYNPGLSKGVLNKFLQDVWNEAVVTNRKDIESINQIAWQQLGGDSTAVGLQRPVSDAARELYDNGLRLANPKESSVSHAFNDTLSSIAMLRGEDFADWEGQTNPLLIVFHNYALEGANLNNIQVGYDPTQGNLLSFGVKNSYDGSQSSGSPRDDFYSWTSQFAEDRIRGTPKEEYSQGRGWRMAVILNGQVISSPVLRASLKDGGTISGRFTQREVAQLAADLKAGSLSFTPRILSEDNVSPELGYEERRQGIISSLVALAFVVIAMVGYYQFAGLIASCAVIFNILVMWGVLQNLGAALTLPGIAGIVLTIGMAVDANVLVFERIREEFAISGRIASAIQAGYRKAFSAIADSNITTIIAAFILIQFDSGPIKGFAVTLIIGILSSMFTSLFMTRYFFAGWVQNPKNKTLKMSQFFGHTHFDFLGQAKKAATISAIAIVLGLTLFATQTKTLFGMDFTGGYSLNVELVQKQDNPSYRIEAMDALLAAGATDNDVQIRELSKPYQLRIQLGTGIEEKGHPFYQMPETLHEGKFAYEYQKNPRINWVVDALEKGGLQVIPSQLPNLENNWSLVSGQLSDTMRNNAIMALGLALFCILIYITFRFEFKYAVGAVIGLVQVVLVTLGVLAFFHWIGLPVQIDLQVIGAIMTIIGYSLNDTIIVFDRIREDLHIMRKMSFKDIVNHALNVTLARTVMTSGTTMLVLLALVFLGGKSIFSFALVMTIGVVVGTASSLFIAAPVLLYFHNREVEERALKKA